MTHDNDNPIGTENESVNEQKDQSFLHINIRVPMELVTEMIIYYKFNIEEIVPALAEAVTPSMKSSLEDTISEIIKEYENRRKAEDN
ncbi:MAG: hypothetical protein KatS3mg002_0441 [Candidatus Woesearchaeota archaeon]|nr:MAG: hypothetical protein KatS3mg002_0441 [Candidatus Woesearchaeota archaeon]